MYQLTKIGVLRLSDGASIPNDPDNTDWQAFVAWRDAGGVAAGIAVSDAVGAPQAVTRRQALLALLAAGKLDQIELLVQNSPRAVRIAWDAAGTFERANPLIEAIASQAGFSVGDIDNLFIEAAKL